MWRLWSKLFGWDYVKYCHLNGFKTETGTARVRNVNGEAIYWVRDRGIPVAKFIKWEPHTTFLTCDKTKYMAHQKLAPNRSCMNDRRIMNLTPHLVGVEDKHGVRRDFAPSGLIMRADMNIFDLEEVQDIPIQAGYCTGINVYKGNKKLKFKFNKEIVYVVSAIVRERINYDLPEYNGITFVSPNTNYAIKDTKGRILYVKGFIK